MRIGILSSGRFWLCDLARELDALGHEVTFYSLVPPWVTRRYGLPYRCNAWLAPLVAPLLAAARLARQTSWFSFADSVLLAALDEVAAHALSRCEVFIGLSGLSVVSLERARSKYGALCILERGSRHILSQRRILDSLTGSSHQSSPPDWAVERELQGYELADRIAVPAQHVVRSFEEYGVEKSRLFRNPYGTDLSMFPATPAPSSEQPPTVLNTGAWSRRKGSNRLADAWRHLRRGRPDARLKHVGPVVDLPLPADDGFEHLPPVAQASLSNVYAGAHVFSLPSYEEGLALVQVQALASGLRLVCSERTGAADLREVVGDAEDLITEVPVEASDGEWASALQVSLETALARTGLRDYLGRRRSLLSWSAYGERYARELRFMVGGRE